MPEQPNPPDRDDPVTERAVSMDTRPAEPNAGAGRAVNAAFNRRRPEGSPAPRTETTGQQDLRIEGAGYPSEDMDDVDPEGDETADDDGYRDEDEDDVEEEDDDGYRVKEEEQGLETGDGQLPELMPERDSFASSLEPGGGQLEQLLVPPSGDALGGDRDSDPNLNGGHGISMVAPEEGPIRIEDEPTDTSIIGHGHEDKAAWNRERVAHLQDIEDDEGDLRDATSEAIGLGGAALSGELQGWEGGTASAVLAQGDDPEFDNELSEMEEVLGDLAVEDMPADVLDDDSIRDPNNMPFLPEHRYRPDDNMSLEEQILATPGEDVLSSGAELGVVEEMEVVPLNQTDSISRTYEDTREFMDDAMEGNERRGGVEDD